MTSTGSKLDLRSIWVDGGPAITLQWLQKENVAGEEERQVLSEIDFSKKIHFLNDFSILHELPFCRVVHIFLERSATLFLQSSFKKKSQKFLLRNS